MDHLAAPTPQNQPATGQSIFWALIALALNAMTQKSSLGSAFDDEFTEWLGEGIASWPLDPRRSSPLICAGDIIYEVFMLIYTTRRQESQSGSLCADQLPSPVSTEQNQQSVGEEQAKFKWSPALTMKTVLFGLGVLPQALKLFSMRGIIGIQLCAGAFLTASVLRVFNAPSKVSIRTSSKERRPPDTIQKIAALIAFLVSILHFGGFAWIYYSISKGLSLHPGNSTQWVLLFGSLTSSVYSIVAMLIFLFNFLYRRSLPFHAVLPIFVSQVINPASFTIKEGSNKSSLPAPPSWMRHFNRGSALLVVVIAGSLLLSGLSATCGELAARMARIIHDRQQQATSADPMEAERAASMDIADAERNVSLEIIDTRSKGDGGASTMARIRIRVSHAAWAVEHHGEWLENRAKTIRGTTWTVGYCIFNLVTAVLYCLAAFDGTGTSSPHWTSILG